MKPVLDPVPSGKPQDWNLSRIQEAKVKVEEVPPIPDEWENPDIKKTARRDQDFRGTCTGQSGAIGADTNYMNLTKDYPTPEDMATFKLNVVEPTGTRHDVLFVPSFSAECLYQKGREAGNVTYPSGGEIRFCARAWRDYGVTLESQWITDKTGRYVVMQPPDPATAAMFAAQHRIEGWAMVDEDWDKLRRAIYEKGWAWIAIPIYKSFARMQGGDGWYPDDFDELDGFHAQVAYGYTRDGIKVVHTWGDFCARFGGFTRKYFDRSKDLMVFMVVLDSNEVRIARGLYSSITVTSNVPAKVKVDGVEIGNTPIKFAVEHGKIYKVIVRSLEDGYIAQQHDVDDSITQLNVVLEALPPKPKEGIVDLLVRWINRILDALRRK